MRGLMGKGTVTVAQIKAIWALAHRAGMDAAILHGWVRSQWRKNSIRALTNREARQVIRNLMLKMAGGVEDRRQEQPGPGMGTEPQLAMILSLGQQIHWGRDHVLHLAGRMYGVKKLTDLTVAEASGLIEALKAIRTRRVA